MEHPDLARALIVVDSNSILSGGMATPFYDHLRAISAPWGTREAVVLEPTANAFSDRHITEDWVSAMMDIAELPKSREVLAKFDALSPTQFFPLFSKQREELIAWIENGGVQVPVLLVWGFNDPSAPLETFGMDTLRLFAQRVPWTQMHVFNEAGHYVFREHPDEFVTAVTNFIEAIRSA
jgi:2-hydroxy-6-oxonona-2,4-dienedioate hydrolase